MTGTFVNGDKYIGSFEVKESTTDPDNKVSLTVYARLNNGNVQKRGPVDVSKSNLYVNNGKQGPGNIIGRYIVE
jgi:hypothetical protein